MKIIEIIIWILAIILISLAIAGITLNFISIYDCKKECDKLNAHHEIIYSGNWDLDDVCICYEKVEIKSWRMG